uniref:Ceramide-1-phosphate transfer protein n=1 Tax=Cacopsylla melanoneura TaxID=428564 RepID=A0A8D9AR23_9HEMI
MRYRQWERHQLSCGVLLWSTFALLSSQLIILSASFCESALTSQQQLSNTAQEMAQQEIDSDTSDKFNYSVLFDNFKQALIDNEDVDLEFYLIGYEELCKFCYLLGKGFGFIGAEIESKINVLKSYQCGDYKDHFRTMKEMIQYEQSANLLDNSDYVSGCRTLLRLHRGLDFFRLFLDGISHLKPDESTYQVGQEVYDATLGLYHSWYIRMGAGVAMYTLPTKCVLFETVTGKGRVEEALEFLPSVIEVANQIYNRIQSCLAENQLLDLP